MTPTNEIIEKILRNRFYLKCKDGYVFNIPINPKEQEIIIKGVLLEGFQVGKQEAQKECEKVWGEKYKLLLETSKKQLAEKDAEFLKFLEEELLGDCAINTLKRHKWFISKIRDKCKTIKSQIKNGDDVK